MGACDLAERVLHPRLMDSGRAPSTALASRFQQMFPVLSPAEIERVRHFGEVRRFLPGEALIQAGKPAPGMYVILSGRVAVAGNDAVGQAIPVAAFAEMMGARPEDLAWSPSCTLSLPGVIQRLLAQGLPKRPGPPPAWRSERTHCTLSIPVGSFPGRRREDGEVHLSTHVQIARPVRMQVID
jgi:hypothetical protein